jgi:hypothetical protein
VTVVTATLRCDRCGKSETILDMEKVTPTWGIVQVTVQPPAGGGRQFQGNLCPDCLLAPSVFNPPKGIEVVHALPDRNGAG